MAEKRFKLFHLVDALKTEENYDTKELTFKDEEDNKKKLVIYTKRAYEKEVCEDIDTIEVGTIKPWQKYDEDRKKSIGKAYIEEREGLEFNVYKKKPWLIQGYACVEQNRYVYVAKRPLFIILLFGLFLFAGCLGLFNLFNPTQEIPEDIRELLPIADGEKWDGEYEKGEESAPIAEQTEIPGYANLFVSSEAPTINLINPTSNTVYFKYIISENDVVIYETDLIKPDEMISANLYDLLTDGEHTLKFQINTYDVETQAACNGATQKVNIMKK